LWSTASICLFEGRELAVICGGSSTSGGIAVFDVENKKWVPTPNQELKNNVPFLNTQRWGHSASVLPDINPSCIYLFGGFTGEAQFNDVHIFDLPSFTIQAVETSGEQPPHRAHHRATVIGKEIFVFGGSICKGGPYIYYDDLYAFNAETRVWRRVKCKGQIPPPRAQHLQTVFGNQLIVLGGCDSNKYFQDAYSFDIEKRKWFELKTSNRQNCTLPQGELSSVEFRVTAASQSMFSVQSKLIVHGKNGTSFLDMRTLKWSKAQKQNEVELYRNCNSFCVDSKNRAFIFGGSNGKEDLSSIYELDLSEDS